MRPSLFFAIFIPIFAAIVTTLFLAYTQNKKLSPKMVKILFSAAAGGMLVFVVIFIGLFS